MASDSDQEQISLWTAVHVEEHGQQKSVPYQDFQNIYLFYLFILRLKGN